MSKTIDSAATNHPGAVVVPDSRLHSNDKSKTAGGGALPREAEKLREQASDKREELTQQASEVAEQAKRKAREAAEHAKSSGMQYAREKKVRLAEEIGVLSDAIRKASGKLHEEQHESIASYVDVAAEQLDRCRQAIETREVGELVGDAQEFARRRPELVYGGLFVAGLAAMRFLKASTSDRQTEVDHASLSSDANRPAAAFGHGEPLHSSQSPVGAGAAGSTESKGGPTV